MNVSKIMWFAVAISPLFYFAIAFFICQQNASLPFGQALKAPVVLASMPRPSRRTLRRSS